MKNLRNLLTAVFIVAAMTIGFTLLRAADAPAVGAKAPDFKLPSEDGTQVSLSQFQGKWVVLYFYPKDFSSGCTVEAHGFERDQDKYAKKNAVVVGVSVDTADSHKDFCAKEGLHFKLLSDDQKKVVEMYGSTRKMGDNTVAARNTFLVDPKGVIQKVFMAVDPAKHSEEVLAALDEVQKAKM